MAGILVIDDDTIMRDMLVQMLEGAGHSATGAGSAKEGLRLLEQHEFNLVVTDIVMPDMEGLETIVRIKTDRKKLPIIAISGGGQGPADKYLKMAHKLGADYAFAKPLDSDQFLGAVRECLA